MWRHNVRRVFTCAVQIQRAWSDLLDMQSTLGSVAPEQEGPAVDDVLEVDPDASLPELECDMDDSVPGEHAANHQHSSCSCVTGCAVCNTTRLCRLLSL